MIRAQSFVRVSIDRRFWLAVLIIYSAGIGIIARDLGDFNIFYTAGLALREGINPYAVPGFYNPLYVALAFVPLTLLSTSAAFHLYAALVMLSYGTAFYLLTQRRVRMTILLMCSPFPFYTAYSGNLESWVLLGAALTPALGIWLVLIKPQIGLVMAALFLVLRWDATHSIRSVAKLALPIGAVFVISWLAGMWRTTPLTEAWNVSLWPLGLLLGVPAAIIALNFRLTDMALFSGPFISPYLGAPSAFAGILPLLARRGWLAVSGVVASWLILFYFWFRP